MPEIAVEVFARPGSRISDDAAQRVYREAQRLPETQRTAEQLVEMAKAPGSEIHDLFQWDDQVAAAEYRKDQARHLMRSIHVRVIREEGVEERPAFFSVAIEAEPEQTMAYVRYSAASEEEAFREQILSRARRDFEAFQSRYRHYESLFSEHAPELVEVLRLADRVLEGETVKG